LSLLLTDLSQDFAIIQANLGFAGSNPLLMPFSLLSSAIILTFEHVPVQLLQFAIAFPGLTAGLAAPAATAPTGLGGLAGLSGLAGLAGLAGLHGLTPVPAGAEPIPVAPIAPAVTPPAPAPVPVAPAPAPPAPAPVPPAPAPAAPAAAPVPPPAPAPPPPAVGAGPPYLVSGMPAERVPASAPARAKNARRTPAAEAAASPAAAAAQEQARRRRRRRDQMRGYGDEYMEMNVQVEPDWGTPAGAGSAGSATASQRGARGFGGTVSRDPGARAGGLTRLAGDGFGDHPREPMLPNTWDRDGDDGEGYERP
jgi:PPE-repeat protein